MANMNIRTPRFYIDYINFMSSRDSAGGHYGIETSNSTGEQIDVVTGNNVAELYDMKPLNQVEFNTTGNTDGHVNLWIDFKSNAFNVDFIAILNHNCQRADAKIRVSSSNTFDDVKTVDHTGSDNTEGSNVLTEILGSGAIINNKAFMVDASDHSWGKGHTIFTMPQHGDDDRYFGIQFEGTNGLTGGSVAQDNGTFSTDHNLRIGSILLGQFYDMPQSPDLSVKRSISFDGVNIQESLGGQKYATMTNHGRKNIVDDNKSPFHTYFNSFGAYGGRVSYDMKFSYISSTDLMPDNYNEFQNSDSAIVEDMWNKTNGSHIPFIFTQDGSASLPHSEADYLFARFAQNSLSMTQVAPDVFDVSMKIEEEF